MHTNNFSFLIKPYDDDGVVLECNSVHTLFSWLRMLQLSAASMKINAAFTRGQRLIIFLFVFAAFIRANSPADLWSAVFDRYFTFEEHDGHNVRRTFVLLGSQFGYGNFAVNTISINFTYL